MNADFTGSNLERCDLSNANLETTDFRHCKLAKVDMSGATTTDAKFDGADIDPDALPK